MVTALKHENGEERKWTYNDYASWELKEGERYELIDGVAYPMVFSEDGEKMMSSPSYEHQTICGEVFRQFANFLRGKPCKVIAAPYDVRLFYKENGDDGIVVQPDISIICDEKKRAKDGCHGAPDLIVEILSPSTSSNDLLYKFNLYMKAGVREYWIVDIENKLVQVCTLTDDSYSVRSVSAPASVPVGIFSGAKDGFAINLEEVFSALA